MGLMRKLQEGIKGLGIGMALMGSVIVSAAPVQESGSEHFPDPLVAVDSDKPQEYAIIVEKSTQSLFVYAFGKTNQVLLRMPCSTGEADGAKSRSGDKKTPEGIYFFTKEHLKRDLSPIYGSRAFPMDYPNLMDQIAGRDGNSIWMHGTNKPLKPRDSNGCIALENSDIDKLSDYITLNRTPIVVVEKLAALSAESSEALKKGIQGFLLQWKAALESGSYHDYLRFYDEAYLPDIAWWPSWLKLQKTQTGIAESMAVEIKNMMLLKHQDTYVALFDQFVKTGDRKVFAGARKLFLSNQVQGFRIVGDDYQVFPEAFNQNTKTMDPLTTVALALVKAPKIQVAKSPPAAKPADYSLEIKNVVDGWLQAWSSKDVNQYGAYYSRDFKSEGGAGLQSWLDYKRQLNKRYDYIKVTQRNLTTQKRGEKVIANFFQTYESSNLKTAGNKQLILVRENGQWKIFREIWKKK